ncbi:MULTISPECIES: hypothetical protein [Streptomyces]|uniref:Uncharacterized protein n=2 Tax=Streptomyces TaxID=1883 RepID=A0ABS9J831_9ACTN|nr:hypothetical protein [Streptomyces tricolor]MCG0061722.1 hypothetical protein [Streptomyces tricolor]MYU30689.1 hypothetical protein [Streptomyces sp. SID7810]CUW31767.1 hypothetical protein TUE45_06516 [Streptomyces reticuli]
MPISQYELDVYAAENEHLAAFRRAQANLHEHTAKEAAAGITHETPEYLRLNQAVIDAAKRLPKRLRYLAKEV